MSVCSQYPLPLFPLDSRDAFHVNRPTNLGTDKEVLSKKEFNKFREWVECSPMVREIDVVFNNGAGDRGSIPGRVIPRTQKMVLDAALLSTQHYKVRINGKVEQSRERSSALPYTSVWKLLKREPSGHPRLWSPTFFLFTNIYVFTLVCVCVCVRVFKLKRYFEITGPIHIAR